MAAKKKPQKAAVRPTAMSTATATTDAVYSAPKRHAAENFGEAAITALLYIVNYAPRDEDRIAASVALLNEAGKTGWTARKW